MVQLNCRGRANKRPANSRLLHRPVWHVSLVLNTACVCMHGVPCACRYDIGVLTNCGPDVDRLCADAKAKVHGNATVLKCLVEHFSLTGGCRSGGRE